MFCGYTTSVLAGRDEAHQFFPEFQQPCISSSKGPTAMYIPQHAVGTQSVCYLSETTSVQPPLLIYDNESQSNMYHTSHSHQHYIETEAQVPKKLKSSDDKAENASAFRVFKRDQHTDRMNRITERNRDLPPPPPLVKACRNLSKAKCGTEVFVNCDSSPCHPRPNHWKSRHASHASSCTSRETLRQLLPNTSHTLPIPPYQTISGHHSYTSRDQRPNPSPVNGHHSYTSRDQRPDPLPNNGHHSYTSHDQRPDPSPINGHHSYTSRDQRPDASSNNGHHSYTSRDQRPDPSPVNGHHSYTSCDQRPDPSPNNGHYSYTSRDQRPAETPVNGHHSYTSRDQRPAKTPVNGHHSYTSRDQRPAETPVNGHYSYMSRDKTFQQTPIGCHYSCVSRDKKCRCHCTSNRVVQASSSSSTVNQSHVQTITGLSGSCDSKSRNETCAQSFSFTQKAAREPTSTKIPKQGQTHAHNHVAISRIQQMPEHNIVSISPTHNPPRSHNDHQSEIAKMSISKSQTSSFLRSRDALRTQMKQSTIISKVAECRFSSAHEDCSLSGNQSSSHIYNETIVSCPSLFRRYSSPQETSGHDHEKHVMSNQRKADTNASLRRTVSDGDDAQRCEDLQASLKRAAEREKVGNNFKPCGGFAYDHEWLPIIVAVHSIAPGGENTKKGENIEGDVKKQLMDTTENKDAVSAPPCTVAENSTTCISIQENRIMPNLNQYPRHTFPKQVTNDSPTCATEVNGCDESQHQTNDFLAPNEIPAAAHETQDIAACVTQLSPSLGESIGLPSAAHETQDIAARVTQHSPSLGESIGLPSAAHETQDIAACVTQLSPSLGESIGLPSAAHETQDIAARVTQHSPSLGESIGLPAAAHGAQGVAARVTQFSPSLGESIGLGVDKNATIYLLDQKVNSAELISTIEFHEPKKDETESVSNTKRAIECIENEVLQKPVKTAKPVPQKRLGVSELSTKITETRERIHKESITWKKRLLCRLEYVLIKKLKKAEKNTGEKASIPLHLEKNTKEKAVKAVKADKGGKKENDTIKSTTVNSSMSSPPVVSVEDKMSTKIDCKDMAVSIVSSPALEFGKLMESEKNSFSDLIIAE